MNNNDDLLNLKLATEFLLVGWFHDANCYEKEYFSWYKNHQSSSQQ